MARIEKTARVENNEFDFENLLSFKTINYVGEWNDYEEAYMIYDIMDSRHAGEVHDMIYAGSLEELICEVKEIFNEEITDVYNEYITTITFNIPK